MHVGVNGKNLRPTFLIGGGFGIGGGATILLHCDVVYVGQSVRLRFPFANLGLVTEFAASYLMPVVLGLQQASWKNGNRISKN